MNKIVLIIGAGGSKEANLPTGHDLKKRIAGLLRIRFGEFNKQVEGDPLIVEALRHIVKGPNKERGDINPYLKGAHHIAKNLTTAISIDNFIDQHRDDEKIATCGKLAIVRSILSAERSSKLFVNSNRNETDIRLDSLEETWYIPFFHWLTENCHKSELKARLDSIFLIIFNYDRCIEHFLYSTLKSHYQLSEEEAAELIRNLNVYHPYGDIGSLPWSNSNAAVVPFGAEPNADQLFQLTQRIRTFCEGTDPNSSEINEIRRHVGEANILIFLGFAFHKLNMKLITPDSIPARKDIANIQCFSTTHGISESNKKVIADQINELYVSDIDTQMTSLQWVVSIFFRTFVLATSIQSSH